jgi:hypothetical protein
LLAFLLAGCNGRAGVSGDASLPGSDATDASDASKAIRSLAITLSDGNPVPPVIAHGTSVVVTVVDAETNQPVPDASWAAAGVCTIDGPPGATHVINFGGFGDCTLTAATAGIEAKATFANIVVDQVKIEGDTSPFRIGETRTFTVIRSGQSPVAAQADFEVALVRSDADDGFAFDVDRSGTGFTLTAVAVGRHYVTAKSGQITRGVYVSAVSSSLHITATGSHFWPGDNFEIAAYAFGPGGEPRPIVVASSVVIPGTVRLGQIGPNQRRSGGSVTFPVQAGPEDCTVIVTDGVSVSNAVSITTEKVASVKIAGPPDPVTVGQTVNLHAVPLNAAGEPFARVFASWADEAKSDVYGFLGSGLDIRASIAKPGTARIVATVQGVSSQPFVSRAVPGGVVLGAVTPTSIAVGGRVTLLVQLSAADGQLIHGAALAPISLRAGEDGAPPTVSFDQGKVNDTDFVFVATGLAATGPAGVPVTATWTDGSSLFRSAPLQLVVK